MSVCGISYLDLTVICGFDFKSLGCLGLPCRIRCEFPVWTSYAWALMQSSGANNTGFFIFPIGIQNAAFSPDQDWSKELKNEAQMHLLGFTYHYNESTRFTCLCQEQKKSMTALWMTLLGDSNGKETWNPAIHHSPVTLVHVAGLAVLESESGLSCMCSSVVFSGLSCMWQGKSFRNPSGYIFAAHPMCVTTHPMYSRPTS